MSQVCNGNCYVLSIAPSELQHPWVRSLSIDLRHLPVRNYCRYSFSSAHLGGLIQAASGGRAGLWRALLLEHRRGGAVVHRCRGEQGGSPRWSCGTPCRTRRRGLRIPNLFEAEAHCPGEKLSALIFGKVPLALSALACDTWRPNDLPEMSGRSVISLTPNSCSTINFITSTLDTTKPGLTGGLQGLVSLLGVCGDFL